MPASRQFREEFSFSELAVAGGMTKRAVQHLMDRRLLPEGKGIKVLKRVCVIGAFVAAGAPLVVAGRVVEKLLWSFNQPDGEMPSKLSEIALGLRGTGSSLPKGAEPNDYWYHCELYARRDLYRPGQTRRGDAYIEVADRERVYLSTRTGLAFHEPLAPDFPETTFEGSIEGWERGTEPRFHSCAELDDAARETATAEAAAARRHPVGLLTINASLAIRNGLDRLAEYREGRAS